MYEGIAYELAMRLINKEPDEKIKKAMMEIVDIYENAGYYDESVLDENKDY